MPTPGRMVAAWEQANVDEGEAIAAYKKAGDAFGRSVRLEKTRAVVAETGDLHMAAGRLYVRRIAFIDRLAWSTKTILGPGAKGTADLAKVEELASSPGKEALRESAEKDFTDAVKSYKIALRQIASTRVDPKLRWVYQGQLASARLALYRVTGDAEVLAEARKDLDDALEDKESSPHLKSLVRLREMMPAEGE